MKEFILDELGNKPKKAKEIKYIITKNNCWECVSHPKSDGNYLLGKRTGRQRRLHRYIWEIYNNKVIPKNMVIMHLCDNTLCLNPSHLKLGTYRENTIDMYNKNRDNNGMRGINHKESSKKLLSKAKQSLNEGQLFQIKKLLLEKTNEKVTEKRKRIGSLFNVSDKTIGRIERGLAPWYSEILNGGLSDWIKEV